jgi:hypothetical protein
MVQSSAAHAVGAEVMTSSTPPKLTPEQVDAQYERAMATERWLDMLLPTGVALKDAQAKDLADAILIHREWGQENRAQILEAIGDAVVRSRGNN